MKNQTHRNNSRGFFLTALVSVALSTAYFGHVPSMYAQAVHAPTEWVVVPIAPVVHAPLTEISGAVKSRVYPDTYWIHNDSGDSARVFGIRASGQIIVPPFDANKYTIGAQEEAGKPLFPGVEIRMASNVDWEDITTDGTNLYLADTGNNGNARRDLGIYVVPEPNPEATTMTTALKRIPVYFPEQRAYPGNKWHFDTEAIYWWQGKLYLLTKWRVAGKIKEPEAGSALYRLDSERTDRNNALTKLAETTELSGWVTGADVSPDGTKVAVLCGLPSPAVFIYASDRVLKEKPIKINFTPGADKVESIAWIDNHNFMLISESGKRWHASG